MENLIPTQGAIPSPYDYRDNYAKAVAMPPMVLPPVFDTTMPGPVLMQAKTPSCVSHSVAQLLQLHEYRSTGKLVDFSPRFLDVLAKRFDGQPIDAGTIPRLVFKLAVKYGCATTATVPNDTSLPLAQYRDDSILTPEAFAEAEKHKIPGYIRVPVTFNDMRQAVFLHGAVSVLMIIGDTWWTPSWIPCDIDPLRVPSSTTGGHQIVVKGWTDNKLNKLRNSWSDKWDIQGEAHYDPVLWASNTTEGWVIAEIPDDVKSFLSTLPGSVDFHYSWNTNLALGMVNEDIKFLQIAMMILGFLAVIPVDQLGIYGPKTAAAVKSYQVYKKISPTAPNSVGPKTRAALNADFSV